MTQIARQSSLFGLRSIVDDTNHKVEQLTQSLCPSYWVFLRRMHAIKFFIFYFQNQRFLFFFFFCCIGIDAFNIVIMSLDITLKMSADNNKNSLNNKKVEQLAQGLCLGIGSFFNACTPSNFLFFYFQNHRFQYIDNVTRHNSKNECR